MKKILSLLFIIICANISYAQTNLFPENGNVGIGTITPNTKLDLKGDLTINSGEDSRIYTSDSPVELNKYLIFLNSTLNKSAAGLKAGGLLISDTYSFANPSKNDLVVKGNIGVGVANTQGYKLAVNGNIRAKEIKVENANWPDYVFAKDYQLPSLLETEKHIREKGHLPGIPSAEEVKVNGVDLGEMNAKLLQKIEELTLYLIETNKKFEAKLLSQQEEINQLKQK
nr:hypothetical protein [Pedobacter panaciterrae]